jgi:hypothetical protein
MNIDFFVSSQNPEWETESTVALDKVSFLENGFPVSTDRYSGDWNRMTLFSVHAHHGFFRRGRGKLGHNFSGEADSFPNEKFRHFLGQ